MVFYFDWLYKMLFIDRVRSRKYRKNIFRVSSTNHRILQKTWLECENINFRNALGKDTFEIWNIQYCRATHNFIHVTSPFSSRRRYVLYCALRYSATKNYFVSLVSFASRRRWIFFRRRRRVRFAERKARRETAVSVLHKAELRKSTMDIEKKHCGEK